jgi:hypothetical protein
MTDADEYRCPNCGSADLASIQTEAIADEVLKCRSCTRLFQIVYEPDGVTERLVLV